MKTNYGYKLFEQDPEGNLYPLFLDKDTIYPMNEWINADRKTLTFDEMEKEYLEH